MNDYEYEFMQDSREKKRTARGAFARASRKRGLKGTVKTPIDYLKGKSRREYMNEQTTTSILSYLEFKDLELPQRAKVLANLLKKYSRADLQAMWGITPSVLAGITYRLKKISPELAEITAEISKVSGKTLRPVKKEEPADNVVVLSLSLSGVFTGAELALRLLSIADGLLNDDRTYKIGFVLDELEGDKCPVRKQM